MDETPAMAYPWFEWARLAILAMLALLAAGGVVSLALAGARRRRAAQERR